MKRTITRMADGRQLIYFDETNETDETDEANKTGEANETGEADDVVRDAVDHRDLPPPPPGATMRYDPLTDEWITIAAHRQSRTFLPPADECPLCPSTPDRQTEIPDSTYDVVVFENRFPSFSEREEAGDAQLPPLNPTRPAQGRCEVVSFTSDHNASFATLSPQRVHTVLKVLAERTATLATIPGVEQVFCFENRGVEIGVTLHHPHGQIYAYPYVTPQTRKMLAAARRHAETTGGRNLFADVLAGERVSGERVVSMNEHWTAFVPAAARWPFEVLLAPHRQVADLPGLSTEEAHAFPGVPRRAGPLRRALRRATAIYFRVAPGTGAHRSGPGLSAPAGVQCAPGTGETEIPGRLGVRHGGVCQRCAPRRGRTHAQGSGLVMTAAQRLAATQRLAAAFAEAYHHEPVLAWAAPGRVNLIGEHTDYNDGFVLPFALPQCTAVAASRLDIPNWTVVSESAEQAVSFGESDLEPGRVTGWAGYVAAVVWALRSAGIPVPGAQLAICSDVPLGSGLSSSAALECAVLATLVELAGAAEAMPRPDWPAVAQRAENGYVGVPSGVMDQSASTLCEAGHALFLDCRTMGTTQVPFDLDSAGLALLIIDTRAPHAHAGGEYAARRATCEAAARALGVPALRDVTDVASAWAALPDDLTRRRVRHVITENARVHETVALLAVGRPEAIGPLLSASHASLRDDYEVTVPELDLAVDAAVGAGALGARMTGGGFGGCVIALTRASRATEVADAVSKAFAARGFTAPATFLATAGPGARRVS